jgi:hypothetical protein
VAERSAAIYLFSFTAIADQTSHNINFESVALQRFQNLYWFGFERKALYALSKTHKVEPHRGLNFMGFANLFCTNTYLGKQIVRVTLQSTPS